MTDRRRHGTAPEKQVVGIGQLAVTRAPGSLITYALGSCLGVVLHDPVARVGGLLHAALPSSDLDPERARRQPGRFVDTGVEELLRRARRLGASRRQLTLKVAGGASISPVPDGGGSFRIGEKNLAALRSQLRERGLRVEAADVGGGRSRTLRLDTLDGHLVVESTEREIAI